MTFTHNEIRDFAANAANGTIVEQALLACKNLESAVYKRKSMTETEITACYMLIQCAQELAAHIADKPVDNTRSMLPRDLRYGLKREIALAVVEHSSRYVYYTEDDIVAECIIDKNSSNVWRFNDEGRLYLWTC